MENHGFYTNQNRLSKAIKIKVILDEYLEQIPNRKLLALDIGTGNGEIAHYLSDYFNVISVDINDHRLISNNFSFLIANESLPFLSNIFDIVISNHVIEHVKNTKEHISEILRVLKPDGWFYLATPNRLWPWEVHYQVPLAHYLPQNAFLWLMKISGKYQEDISLQTSWQLNSLCSEFSQMNSISEKICSHPERYQLQIHKSLNRILNNIPIHAFNVAHLFMPTFIFMLQKGIYKKKILWLTSSYPRFEDDSASIFLRNLTESLIKQNFDIHVLSPDHQMVDNSANSKLTNSHHFSYFFPRNLQKLAYGSGILPNLKANPWLYLQIPIFIVALLFSTWRLLLHLKPQLLHAHWVFPQGTVAVLFGKLLKIPTIVTAHGGDAFALNGSILGYIKKWTIKNCTAWTGNTFATANAVGEDLKQPKIIPMGINYQLFSSGKPKKSTGSFILLFVGRLVEKKGVHGLISAYSLLPKTLQKNSELWIIGDGCERIALETLATSLKLNERILFLGKIPNKELPDYYASADIFIAPSITDSSGDTEGQGVILLEALASGVGVISTKTGGISEIIQEGKNGILTTPGDTKELSGAIQKLLNDKILLKKLAIEGQQMAKAYDWQLIGWKFAELYENLIP
jgi:glycosyltransferase involved in cell wall biosynthesis/SAM-dependent methyltransferase